MCAVPDTLDADYLVVGAGAAGMAFVDALIDHADVTVVMVDRRHGVGGHWLDAYPFVRLHQASPFYGVASTLLGDGRVQQDGPEAGLHERSTAPEVCAYYARVLRERMLASGRVSFYPNCEYVGDRRFVSRAVRQAYEVRERRARRRCPLPLARDTGDDTGAVRGGRRRRTSCRSTTWSGSARRRRST